jgi:hypothetical protein
MQAMSKPDRNPLWRRDDLIACEVGGTDLVWRVGRDLPLASIPALMSLRI